MATAIPEIGYSGDAALSGEGSFSRPWTVHGATSEAHALSTVAAAAPSTVSGLVISGVSFQEETEGVYRCSVDYGTFKPRQPPAPGESQFNFEVTTVSQRVVLPLSAQTVYPRSGETAPTDSDKWLIGQQADGSAPEGAEVFEPNASFSETHWISASAITSAYRKTLMQTVGKINNAAFKGWATGEVLCTGVSGSRRGEDDWEISFRFQVKENQTGLEIAGITGINKDGWQIVWPRYELQKDADEPILSNVVKYIVVASVIQSASFGALGIGTT